MYNDRPFEISKLKNIMVNGRLVKF